LPHANIFALDFISKADRLVFVVRGSERLKPTIFFGIILGLKVNKTREIF
jgi:hypothetical protein